MRLNIYQPLLLAVGANIALSTHWNYWNHAHGKLLHHAQQLEPRGDLLELNGDQIPADLVELRYTTTTLYQDCLPTSTAFITVTICEDEPSAPTQSLPQFPTNVVQAQPPPEETTVVHSTRTRTITVTEPSTETITLISQHHSTSTAIPADAPSPPAVIPFQHVPNVAFTQAVTPTHLSTTITTSIPGLGSATVSVAADVGDAPSGSAFVGDRPVPAPTKVEQGPGLLPTLPHLPQLLPTTVIPNLPIPSLDQVFHPANPSIPSDLQWTSLPKDGAFSTKGFGGRSIPHGNRIKYEGNVGILGAATSSP
ncbi:hypothetical protein N7470_002567 [Penicillium chermesinum]|nr:hypothetical protein N7470_002567 [Penicillium chermesinum]